MPTVEADRLRVQSRSQIVANIPHGDGIVQAHSVYRSLCAQKVSAVSALPSEQSAVRHILPLAPLHITCVRVGCRLIRCRTDMRLPECLDGW